DRRAAEVDVGWRHLARPVADVVGVAGAELAGRSVAPAADVAADQPRTDVALAGHELDHGSAHVDVGRRHLAGQVTDVDEVAIAEPAGAAAAPAAHDPALEQRAVEPAARGDLNHGLGSEQGVDRRHLAGVVSDVVLVADTQRSGAVVSPATDLTGLQDRAVV